MLAFLLRKSWYSTSAPPLHMSPTPLYVPVAPSALTLLCCNAMRTAHPFMGSIAAHPFIGSIAVCKLCAPGYLVENSVSYKP